MQLPSSQTKVLSIVVCWLSISHAVPTSIEDTFISRAEHLATDVPPEIHTIDTSKIDISAALLNNYNLTATHGRAANTKPVPSRLQERDNRTLRPMGPYPYTAMGRLISKWVDLDGKIVYNRCTASLVGPRIIATASHCVKTEWPQSSYQFQPGYNEGVLNRQNYAVMKVYKQAWTGSEGYDGQQDVAILVLASRVGLELGYLVPQILNRETEIGVSKFSSFGYPGDRYGGRRAVGQDNIKVFSFPNCAIDENEDALYAKMDASPGMSGGPLFTMPGMTGVSRQYGVVSLGIFVGNVTEHVVVAAGDRFVSLVLGVLAENL